MLHIQFEDHELPELRTLLNRAMGCWEPAAQPKWVQQLSDLVDQRMGTYVAPFNVRQDDQPTQ